MPQNSDCCTEALQGWGWHWKCIDILASLKYPKSWNRPVLTFPSHQMTPSLLQSVPVLSHLPPKSDLPCSCIFRLVPECTESIELVGYRRPMHAKLRGHAGALIGSPSPILYELIFWP